MNIGRRILFKKAAFVLIAFLIVSSPVPADAWDLPEVVLTDRNIKRLESALVNIKSARIYFTPASLLRVVSDINFFVEREGAAADLYLLMYYISFKKQRKALKILKRSSDEFKSSYLYSSLKLRYLLTFATRKEVFKFLDDLDGYESPAFFQDMFKVLCFYGDKKAALQFLKKVDSEDFEVLFWKDFFGILSNDVVGLFREDTGIQRAGPADVLKYMQAGIINKKIISEHLKESSKYYRP